MPQKMGRLWFKHVLPPRWDIEKLQLLRVHDGKASMIEKEHDKAHDISQVIQILRVGHFALKDQILRCGFDLLEQSGMLLAHSFESVLRERKLRPLRARHLPEVHSVPNPRGAILRGRDFRLFGELAVKDIENQRAATARFVARAGPGCEVGRH